MCLRKHQEELRIPSLGEQHPCPAQETEEPMGRASRVTARNPEEYSGLCSPTPKATEPSGEEGAQWEAYKVGSPQRDPTPSSS